MPSASPISDFPNTFMEPEMLSFELPASISKRFGPSRRSAFSPVGSSQFDIDTPSTTSTTNIGSVTTTNTTPTSTTTNTTNNYSNNNNKNTNNRGNINDKNNTFLSSNNNNNNCSTINNNNDNNNSSSCHPTKNSSMIDLENNDLEDEISARLAIRMSVNNRNSELGSSGQYTNPISDDSFSRSNNNDLFPNRKTSSAYQNIISEVDDRKTERGHQEDYRAFSCSYSNGINILRPPNSHTFDNKGDCMQSSSSFDSRNLIHDEQNTNFLLSDSERGLNGCASSASDTLRRIIKTNQFTTPCGKPNSSSNSTDSLNNCSTTNNNDDMFCNESIFTTSTTAGDTTPSNQFLHRNFFEIGHQSKVYTNMDNDNDGHFELDSESITGSQNFDEVNGYRGHPHPPPPPPPPPHHHHHHRRQQHQHGFLTSASHSHRRSNLLHPPAPPPPSFFTLSSPSSSTSSSSSAEPFSYVLSSTVSTSPPPPHPHLPSSSSSSSLYCMYIPHTTSADTDIVIPSSRKSPSVGVDCPSISLNMTTTITAHASRPCTSGRKHSATSRSNNTDNNNNSNNKNYNKNTAPFNNNNNSPLISHPAYSSTPASSSASSSSSSSSSKASPAQYSRCSLNRAHTSSSHDVSLSDSISEDGYPMYHDGDVDSDGVEDGTCPASRIRKKNFPCKSSEHFLQDESDDVTMSWSLKAPQFWSSSEVLDWLFYVAQEQGLDMQKLRAENFQSVSGARLCQMDIDDFSRLEPIFGLVIHDMLHKLMSGECYIKMETDDGHPYGHSHSTLSPTYSNHSDNSHFDMGCPTTTTTTNNNNTSSQAFHHESTAFFPDIKQEETSCIYQGAPPLPSGPHYFKHEQPDSAAMHFTPYHFDMNDSPPSCLSVSQGVMYPGDCFVYQGTSYPHGPPTPSPHSSSIPAHCCYPAPPHPPLNPPPPSHPAPPPPPHHHHHHPPSSSSASLPLPRRKPGRPRVKNVIQTAAKSSKDKKAKNQHLWEFIYEILMNPMYNPQYLKWENQREGVFRFVQSEAVAQLWGGRKNNENMTYEKLSRAMRHYYRRGILERVEGRRLVYKFSLKAIDRMKAKKNNNNNINNNSS